MQPSLGFVTDHFLTILEKKALLSLDEGNLKRRIHQLLLSGETRPLKMAKVSLEIIHQTTVSNSRERFLNHALVKPDLNTLNKILQIAVQGFFDELINQFNFKKKAFYTPQQINKMINNFTPPQPANNHSLAIPNAYLEVQNCSHYHQLPKLSDNYAKSLGKNSLSEKFQYLFHLLNTNYNSKFEESEKVYITKILLSLQDYSEMDLYEFLSLALLLKEETGEEALNYFLDSAKGAVVSINELIRGLQLFNLISKQGDFYQFFEDWTDCFYQWDQVFECLESYIVNRRMEESLFKEDIYKRLERFKMDSTVSLPLSNADLNRIGIQYQKINLFCEKNQHLEFNQLINQAHLLRSKVSKNTLTIDDRLTLIAIGRLTIRLQFGIYLYSTQILALLGLLLRGENRQAQVKTGEGKSLIIALWAFVMAMECRGVDIITSARYLAIRDQKKFVSFFNRSGISTSHICFKNNKPAHFRAQILYGTAVDFEFAWMQDQIRNSKFFEERLKVPFVMRNFDVVCVDESDNLLIDVAEDGARIAYPSEVSYDWIYAPLLSCIKRNGNQLTIQELQDFICTNVNQENQRLCRQISDQQMRIWIHSANQALNEKKENVDYVIRIIRNEDGEIEKRSIQIVNLKTGRILENNRWMHGMHEFLEVIHNLTLEKESLEPISLSHAVFYEFYQNITAVTGTSEVFQTKNIYKINTFHVPTHHPLIRKDFPLIIAKTTDEYYFQIIKTAKDFIQCKRTLLILTATIQDSLILEKEIQTHKIPYQMLNEIQVEEEHLVIARAGKAGKITLATPTAGRGVDFVLDKQSIQNGGLHVLVTFYPDSDREELQAIGRAGRQGQPGSSQIIINLESQKIHKILTSFPNKSIEEALTKYRKLLAKEQNIQQVGRVRLERYFATKNRLFFTVFRDWVQMMSQEFINVHSVRLSKVKLTSTKQNDLNFIGLLKKKEKDLAEECKRLLTSKNPQVSWEIFLTTLTDHLKDRILIDWTKNYFQPMQQKIQNTDGPQVSINEIDNAFNNYRPCWDKYLDKNGLGIFIYLEELTTLKLA